MSAEFEQNKIKVYMSDTDQDYLDTLGQLLQSEGVYGMVTPKGAVNRSMVIRYLIDQERRRRTEKKPRIGVQSF